MAQSQKRAPRRCIRVHCMLKNCPACNSGATATNKHICNPYYRFWCPGGKCEECSKGKFLLGCTTFAPCSLPNLILAHENGQNRRFLPEMFGKKISAFRAELTRYSRSYCTANDTRIRCEYCAGSYATMGTRNWH